MHWVIDRFEGNWAVLENTQTLEIKKHAREDLPPGVSEGAALRLNADGSFGYDKAETAARRERINNKFARLQKRHVE